MMWDWHPWWWLVSAGALVFWGVIVWLLFVEFSQSRSARDDPETVLANRFARGEIDAAEYRERLDTLQSRPSRGAPLRRRAN
jgi:putative membrane protein